EQKVIDFLLKSEIDIPQTMIVISHDLSVLQRLTNRIIVLKDELIVDDFKTNELFDSERNEYTKLLIETFE
ncbi:peptide ABC transporter ATP-binding protein, partial [Staphylococcus haemolyticus]